MSTRSQDSSTKQDHQPPSLGKSSSDFARNGRGGQSTQQQIPSPLRPGFGGMRTRRSVDDPFTSNTARDTSRLTERSPSKSASPQKTPKLDPNAVGGGDPHATAEDMASSFASSTRRARARLRSPWACSPLTLLTAVVALSLAGGIVHSFLTRQLDPKGCAMSYMRPSFAKYTDFDTEHTRFASKYSLYLYREGGIDEDPRVKGIPILFIPGNAGSYKQVRPLAAEAAVYFDETLRATVDRDRLGKRPLDFFSVDFNEDITAFHGQTLLDQAEYLNEAVAYILSLYHNPAQSLRDTELPDPSSVILIGHSMGGVVARAMLTMPNYQTNSINTILTLAAPHARAPVSFDAEIVNTYKDMNGYWRKAFSQQRISDNPLSQLSLISFAGGGLDTMVPSDYSTLASLVPPSHGFTVFTSTIPHVWTGMDHLAITWCDQLRKSIVRALYDVVDAARPNQTRPLPDRIRAFKKRFLTGMEDVAEKTLLQRDPGTLLTLEDNSNSIISQGERLVLRDLGAVGKTNAYLLPIPPQGTSDGKRFTLLTDQSLDLGADISNLEVMFCSVFPLHAGQSAAVFSMNMDLSGDTPGSTRLACKNAASDAIVLPASTEDSTHPFDDGPPFSYLQYDLEQLTEYQFVAVIDKTIQNTPGWVIAEFNSRSESSTRTRNGLKNLLFSGVDVSLPATRALVSEIEVPAVHSSLLAYKLRLDKKTCRGKRSELFMPLLRQHISEPHESKFFVNVRETDISMHGLAPYMPPSLKDKSHSQGLYLQLWSDPSCNSTLHISMNVDVVGSMGKLWMRYRTVFAAFPLLVVALVLRKQFQLYDQTGIFMSFSESMDQSLRRSVPVLLMALTFLTMSFSKASQATRSPSLLGWQRSDAAETAIDFTVNDLLLGSQDPFFWFLVPLFGLISVGICISANYALLGSTHLASLMHASIVKLLYRNADTSKSLHSFTETSLAKRIITTSVLLVLVSTVIPYQFVFVVLCIVQVATCVRALSLARETRSGESMNFYNYAHSIVLLMLWVLPINIPVLVVWVHNLAVHWLTPFSSHHNILSIMPFVVLIETLSTGKMVPRIESRTRHLTSALFFSLAMYAAVYGVTYAYLLHYIVNIVCMWLAALHASNMSMKSSMTRFNQAFRGKEGYGVHDYRQDVKKRP